MKNEFLFFSDDTISNNLDAFSLSFHLVSYLRSLYVKFKKNFMTYFLPRDINPYIIPVVNIKPLPNMLLIAGHTKIAGNANLK